MTDQNDPILESCLHEVLGGKSPPDLSLRILAAWSASQSASFPAPSGQALVDAAEPTPPPVILHQARKMQGFADQTKLATSSKPAPSPKRQTFSSTIAFSVSLAGVLAFVALIWSVYQRSPSEINSRQKLANVEKRLGQGDLNQRLKEPRISSSVNQPTIAKDIAPPQASLAKSNHQSTQLPRNLPPLEPSTAAKNGTLDKVQNESTAVANNSNTKQRFTEPASNSDVVSFINDAIREKWKSLGLVASPEATDSEWCRRVYLRLIGRIPTVDELRQFVESKANNKRSDLVDRLQNHEQYAEEYASYWATVWTNVLAGRSGGASEEGKKAREGLRQYLRHALHRNKPFDLLATELISATGSNQEGDSDFNGAVNFVVANMNSKGTQLTARVSRVFLGLQLQCSQCHAHPSDDSQQDQFWQLNAFFRQTDLLRSPKTNAVRVVNRDFAGEGEGRSQDAEIYFERRDGRLRAVFPVFIDGTAIPRSGRISDVNRRNELARLVAQSDNFAKATVNRIWAQFFGYGFTRPIDDIGPHITPSHPDLFEKLSKQFAVHDFDLRQLNRWIALSEPFRLSSKITDGNSLDRPDVGAIPLFTHYYTRQLQAEEIFQSLQILASARRNNVGSEREKARQTFLGQIGKNLGPSDTDDDRLVQAVPQPLLLMQNELTQGALRIDQDSILGRVAKSDLPIEEKIDHLFQAAVARKPSKKEITAAKELIVTAGESSVQGLQDLWWALLNSNEFILDH